MLQPLHMPSRAALLAAALLLANAGLGGEAVEDFTVTTYGERNPAAPAQLDTFAFLVGKWSGTAQARAGDGSVTEYTFDWSGRYVLDGMAIADEMRMANGGAVQGMSLRYFDASREQWVVEFLNFARAFVRRQVGGRWGDVTREETRDGARVTITMPGQGGLGREVYTLVDPDHFTYTLALSSDGGQNWGEAMVTMTMTREEHP